MADQVNKDKDKQSNLDNFIKSTPKSNNKRGQPSSSPDIASPSMLQAEKQARLASLGSSPSNGNNQGNDEKILASAIQTDTVIQLSQVVCAILKNQEFLESLIPVINEKVIELIKPKVHEIVDECLQQHLPTIQHNKEALVQHETELNKHNEEIKILRNTINKLESRLEEQEQYSRRTSLRFNNVSVHTNTNGDVIKPIDTDSLVLGICKNKLKVDLKLHDIGRSHPIGDIRDGKTSTIVRFLSYRQRQMVYSNKRKLKNNPDKTFIAENLTKHRYDLLNRLNTLGVNQKINSFLNHDGSLIVKETELSRPRVVRSRQDIYKIGGEILEGDEDSDISLHAFYMF